MNATRFSQTPPRGTRAAAGRAGRPHLRPGPSPRGVTLLELLVAISILLMLVVVVLPNLAPTSDSRQVREVARSINVLFGVARGRAMETGRPAGVWLDMVSLPPTPDGLPRWGSTTLRLAEMPPIYAGESSNALVTVNQTLMMNLTITANKTSFSMAANYINPGDRIRLNYQGPAHRIDGYAADWITAVNDAGALLPWPANGSGSSDPVPFEIARRPVPGRTAPLQLPSSVVVDLTRSGNQRAEFPNPAGDTSPVIILFGPSGAVTDLYYYHDSSAPQGAGFYSEAMVDPLYLLIGRRVEDPALENWQNMANLWIMINPQTGLVAAKEMGPTTAKSWTAARVEVRRYARDTGVMGGR